VRQGSVHCRRRVAYTEGLLREGPFFEIDLMVAASQAVVLCPTGGISSWGSFGPWGGVKRVSGKHMWQGVVGLERAL
jgi:hypothetical protein